MNRKVYSILTIIVVSFALFLGAGVFDVGKAAPGTSGERFTLTTSVVNQVGNDEAANCPELSARDQEAAAPNFSRDRDISRIQSVGGTDPSCPEQGKGNSETRDTGARLSNEQFLNDYNSAWLQFCCGSKDSE